MYSSIITEMQRFFINFKKEQFPSFVSSTSIKIQEFSKNLFKILPTLFLVTSVGFLVYHIGMISTPVVTIPVKIMIGSVTVFLLYQILRTKKSLTDQERQE